MTQSPAIVVLGAVASTRRTLAALLRNGANVVGALGLAESKSRNVSGYTRLDDLCEEAEVTYHDFIHVNDAETIAVLQQLKPDLLFLVGLSQLANESVVAIPTQGTVGFHPTALPKMRGRAPVAWLILEQVDGAATFFLMNSGVDAGPILTQAPFTVEPDDYAADVMAKIDSAIDLALDNWIPLLIDGTAPPALPQDESAATWRGRRSRLDGLIDWNQSADDIYRLIRAAGKPHPGAYTHFNNSKLIVWRCEPMGTTFQGVPGRILDADQTSLLVQTGTDALRITDYEFQGSIVNLRTGQKLGYTDEEIFKLRKQIDQLQTEIATLRDKLP